MMLVANLVKALFIVIALELENLHGFGQAPQDLLPGNLYGYDEACPRAITINGAETSRAAFMGLYREAPDVGSSDNAGRPVYENAHGKYLYFWAPSSNWMIDIRGGESNARGFLFANSDVGCPTEASGWEVWDGRAWTSTYHITVKEACPADLTVGGAEALRSEFMGEYHQTQIHGQRPVYQNANGKYLYFLPTGNIWMMGNHEGHINARGFLYASGDAACPTKASGWKVWDGSAWTTTFSISVTETCSATMVLASAQALWSDFMGAYHQISIPGSRDNGKRPIYENANGKYLYFWVPQNNWMIDNHGGHDNARGFLYAHGDVACPIEAFGWKVWDGSAWTKTHSITVVEACSPTVIVASADAGAETLRSEFMGVYRQKHVSGSTQNNYRPIYENANGKYLYFWVPDDAWMIGNHRGNNHARSFFYATGNAACPTAASGWRVWDGSAWRNKHSISVVGTCLVGDAVKASDPDGRLHDARIVHKNSDGTMTVTWKSGDRKKDCVGANYTVGADKVFQSGIACGAAPLSCAIGNVVNATSPSGRLHKARIASINSNGTITIKLNESDIKHRTIAAERVFQDGKACGFQAPLRPKGTSCPAGYWRAWCGDTWDCQNTGLPERFAYWSCLPHDVACIDICNNISNQNHSGPHPWPLVLDKARTSDVLQSVVSRSTTEHVEHVLRPLFRHSRSVVLLPVVSTIVALTIFAGMMWRAWRSDENDAEMPLLQC